MQSSLATPDRNLWSHPYMSAAEWGGEFRANQGANLGSPWSHLSASVVPVLAAYKKWSKNGRRGVHVGISQVNVNAIFSTFNLFIYLSNTFLKLECSTLSTYLCHCGTYFWCHCYYYGLLPTSLSMMEAWRFDGPIRVIWNFSSFPSSQI